jgi:hypothetical protein
LIVVGTFIALTGCGVAAPGASAPSANQGTGTIEITGKVAAAQSKNKRGEEIKVAAILVSEAKTTEGKPVDTLKGKTVLTNRRDGLELLKFENKEVTVIGSLDPNANNVFRLETVRSGSAAAPIALAK